MKLADYLETIGKKRGDFAREIGVTPGWVTQLCDGSGWPSQNVAERISSATGGMVTANDFLASNAQDPHQQHDEGADGHRDDGSSSAPFEPAHGDDSGVMS